jgi:hypothetical protein
MITDHINDYDAQLKELDSKLKPLGDRPYENGTRKYASPLDELGVRTEAVRLMTGVKELYAGSNPETRDRIRDIFTRYCYVRWALWPSQEPTTPELFRLQLLAISMRDAGDDPRDMVLWVSRACKVAVSAGVDVGPVLESVAAISSDQEQYRYRGSMREVMLEAKRYWLSDDALLPPPSPDLAFYNRLGLERSDQPCRKEGCLRGAVVQSVYCRVHHFEMVMGKPCPFSH